MPPPTTTTTTTVTNPRAPPPSGFKFAFDPSLSALNVTAKAYLAAHPEYDGLATGALVFSDKSSSTGENEVEDRVLLVQRAAHDSMPCLWETPGGACDAEDETILHGLARELWEESGLRLTRAVRQIDAGLGTGVQIFHTRRGLRLCKFNIEAEVEVEAAGAGAEGGKPLVTLDPNEHQSFLWVTEAECRAHMIAASETAAAVQLKFTHSAQEAVILEGFRLRKKKDATAP